MGSTLKTIVKCPFDKSYPTKLRYSLLSWKTWFCGYLFSTISVAKTFYNMISLDCV